MMKKRYVLSVFAVLLCFCSLLCSCGVRSGSAAKLNEIYNDKAFENEFPTLTSGEKVYIEGTLYDHGGSLAVITDGNYSETRYRVYNYVTDQIIFEWTDSADAKLSDSKFGFLEVNNDTLFWIIKDTKVDKKSNISTVIYDSEGHEITSLPKKTEPVAVADMMMVENRYYRKENGTYQLKFEHSMLSAELPEFTHWNEDYYYAVTTSGFSIYDPSGTPVGSYSFRVDAVSSTANVMSDGNILIQYTLALPSDAGSYDIYDSGNERKLQLVSLIYQVKNGKTKSVKLDYIMTVNIARGIGNELYPAEEYDCFHKSIDNIAIIVPIEDKRISDQLVSMAAVDNRGGVKKLLNNTLSDQSSVVAMPAVKDRYMITTQSGLTVLVNGKGERIGDISNVDMDHSNNVFVLTGGRIYDLDLRYVYDYSNDGYELEYSLNDVLLLSKQGEGSRAKTEYYIMKKGMTVPEKLSGTLVDSNDSYYVIQDTDKNYIYYNASGEELFRLNKKLELIEVSADNSVLLLKEGNMYYRFKK